MAFRKKFAKRKFAKRRRPMRRKVGGKAIRKVVRREMRRVAETKTFEMVNLGKNIYPSNHVSFPDNVIPLGPNSSTMVIAQGVGQGDRIGNKLTIKKLSFKGTIVPLPQDATLNPNPRPLQVRMDIVYDREDPNDAFVPGSLYFQLGNSSSAHRNDLVDMWAPVNTDRYRVLHTRIWKLGYGAYTGTATSATNQATQQAYANNDFPFNVNFNIDVTKYLIKTVKYNDTSVYPLTRGCYAFFYACYADGNALASTTVPCAMQFVQNLQFTDV